MVVSVMSQYTGRSSSPHRSAVLLDFDGTIANTGTFIMRCAREALIECGYPREAEGDLHSLIGPPLCNGFADLCHQSLEEGIRITEVYRRIFDGDMSPDYYPVFPGMRELIAPLHQQGRRVAIATSRLETTACQMIDSLNLPPALMRLWADWSPVAIPRRNPFATLWRSLVPLSMTP